MSPSDEYRARLKRHYCSPPSRAARTVEAGWWCFDNMLAHLVVGYRTTCGRSAAPFWVRERLRDRLAELDDYRFDELADELELEAVAEATQLRLADERRLIRRSKRTSEEGARREEGDGHDR